MRKYLLAGVAAAAIGGFALAPSAADATVVVDWSVNGGATSTLCSGAGGCSETPFSQTLSGVNIQGASGSSNSPGTLAQSNILSSTVSLTNTGSSAATIVLTIGDTGYTSPTAPPTATLFSHVGGTVNTGAASNLLSFVSYVDTLNTQNGTGGFAAPTLSPSIIPAGSFKDDSSLAIANLAAPFSMTGQYTMTLGAGSQINFSSSSRLEVPEPGSLALLGTALVGLGLVGWLTTKKRRIA